MVPRWRFLAIFCVLYFQLAACRVQDAYLSALVVFNHRKPRNIVLLDGGPMNPKSPWMHRYIASARNHQWSTRNRFCLYRKVNIANDCSRQLDTTEWQSDRLLVRQDTQPRLSSITSRRDLADFPNNGKWARKVVLCNRAFKIILAACSTSADPMLARLLSRGSAWCGARLACKRLGKDRWTAYQRLASLVG